MCKSHHVTTDKGVDGRTHHNPDDFASPIVKVAFVEKLLAPRLLAYYTNQITRRALALAKNEIEQRKLTEMELRKLTRAVEVAPQI